MPRIGLRVLLAAALVSAALVSTPPPAVGQDVLITGGTLVDPGAGTVTEADLLAVGGTIVAVGDIRLLPEGFAGRVVDASGKWVVPGLRDFHVHAFSNRSPGRAAETLTTSQVAERMLYAGVTSFLDLFNLEDYVLLLRDHQRETRGEMEHPLGADLFAAGPCLTAPGGHCTEYRIPTRTISTPEEARREIGELAAERPDVVKLVYAHDSEGPEGEPGGRELPSIDRPTLEAAVAAAAEHGIPTVVHVESWRDVREAAEAGATAVTHVPDEPVPEGLPAFLAERGTVLIPTLSTRDTALATDPALLEDPLLRSLTTPEILAAYRDFPSAGERAERVLRSMASSQERRLASLGALAAAGVPIVAGTDSGNPWTVQGFSLHRELELMVEAGLEPMAALRAATAAAGDFLGHSWGLAPGDPASLLVLDASPLDDVRNTRAIHAVIHRGRVIDREGLVPGAGATPGARQPAATSRPESP